MGDRPDSPLLRWRPLAVADVPAWHALVERVAVADRRRERPGPGDLADLLGWSWLDHAADTVLGLDDDGVPRAYGVVDLAVGDLTLLRPFCDGAVDPAVRGRGIGRSLLAWQVRRCADLVAARRKTVGEQVPARAMLWAEDVAPGGTRVAAHLGFAAARWFTTMERTLDGPLPVPAAADGVRIVPLTEDLDEATRLVSNTAFVDHWGSQPSSPQEWATMNVGGPQFRRRWSFVAVAGGEVVGLHLGAAFEHEWEVFGRTQGWSAEVGVLREWRGRGVASALLATALRTFADEGLDTAGLGVDSDNPNGAVRLYERLGYQRAFASTTWTLDL